MNCPLVEQCSFFRVFFGGQWLMHCDTYHRGLYTVVSGSGPQNADRPQQGPAGPRRTLSLALPKTSTGKIIHA